MGTIVKKKQVATGDQMSAWKSFIDSFNNSFVTTSTSGNTLYIDVNGELTINIANFDANFLSISCTKNGSTSSGYTIWSNGSNKLCEITIVSNTRVFYFHVKDGDSRRQLVVYEKISNSLHVSGWVFAGDMAQSFRDIKSVTLTNVDGSVTCNHAQILNYANDVGYIDYLPKDIVLNGTARVAEDENFVTCTSVTIDSIITFANTNYYSVGANTLIKVDLS